MSAVFKDGWGQRLSEARGRLTGKQLGEAGFKPPTIANYINEQRTPKLDWIDKFCGFTGVRQQWLLTGEGSKYRGAESPDRVRLELERRLEEFLDEHGSNPKLNNRQKASLLALVVLDTLETFSDSGI